MKKGPRTGSRKLNKEIINSRIHNFIQTARTVEEIADHLGVVSRTVRYYLEDDIMMGRVKLGVLESKKGYFNKYTYRSLVKDWRETENDF